MILTKDGENLYNQIKDSVNVLSSIKDSVDQISNINLGIQINFSSNFYRPILTKLKEKNPNIDFTISKSNTENMFSKLKKMKLMHIYQKYSQMIFIVNQYILLV